MLESDLFLFLILQYMHPFIENLSSEMFDQLMNHMIYCANMFRSNAEKDARKAVLSQLFVSCDHAGVSSWNDLIQYFVLMFDVIFIEKNFLLVDNLFQWWKQKIFYVGINSQNVLISF